jgi:cytochrome P450
MRVWVFTRYADVAAFTADPRLSADRISVMREWLPDSRREELLPLYDALGLQLLFQDGAEHRRLRALMNRAFTPRVVTAMRPSIQAAVDSLLDVVLPTGRMDVIRDLAFPLPAIVIARVLGIPEADRDVFKGWSDDVASFIGLHAGTPGDVARKAATGMERAQEYFRAAVAERRRQRRDDLLSALLDATEEADRLTDDELLANAVLLLAAAHETTTNLIGNALVALLRHPAQLRVLRDLPSLMDTAVEEFLRYDSPVQFLARTVTEEMLLEGRHLRRSEGVLLALGAANRDPDQFPSPDTLDISRRENRHLAFGHGPHFCLGAALARVEATVALETLLRRAPELRLAAEPLEWQPSFAFRGVKSLPVEF